MNARERESTQGGSVHDVSTHDVSIHDVMPETLDAVDRTLAFLRARGLADGAVTLLVVPGRDWSADDVARVRSYADAGCAVAGHGWVHRVERFGGLYHRLHGLLLSRRVAEHLALDEDGIARLLVDNFAWFGRQDLPEPELYVPPAWALGSIRRQRLRDLPFRRYEVLGGNIDAGSGRLERQPLVGYEADAAWRVPPLRAWNAWNRRRAVRTGATLRVAIHPFDIELRLRDDLARDVEAAAAAAAAEVSAISPRRAPCATPRAEDR